MSENPNRIELNNGGYLLFDYFQGSYRIAIYTRHVSKSTSLSGAVATALGKPPHSSQVKQICEYAESIFHVSNQELTLAE